jgi:hypothetical protein
MSDILTLAEFVPLPGGTIVTYNNEQVFSYTPGVKWVKGRQGTGYERFTLFNLGVCDMHILRYKKGTHIPPHKDVVPHWKHFRINIIFKKAVGGSFICPDAHINWSRLKLFRNDIHEHSVNRVEDKTRYVLSIGFLL